MYSTKNVWGILIIVVGVLALLQQVPYIGQINFSTFVFGLGFLALYYFKKKDWALWIAIPLLVFGALDIISFLRLPFGEGVLMMLVGLGLFYLYYTKKFFPILLPASILAWLGTYDILEELYWMGRYRTALFFFCMAGCVFTIYKLGEEKVSRKWYRLSLWILGFAIFSFIVEFGKLRYLFMPYMHFIFPIFLIGVGAWIVLKGWKNN